MTIYEAEVVLLPFRGRTLSLMAGSTLQADGKIYPFRVGQGYHDDDSFVAPEHDDEVSVECQQCGTVLGPFSSGDSLMAGVESHMTECNEPWGVRARV
jgi:hypothetical protein